MIMPRFRVKMLCFQVGYGTASEQDSDIEDKVNKYFNSEIDKLNDNGYIVLDVSDIRIETVQCSSFHKVTGSDPVSMATMTVKYTEISKILNE